MACPSCGAANAGSARFCGSCGARLTATCPHCQADVQPGLRFCNACGGAIPLQPRRPDGTEAEPAAASERRIVSVLFLDLEGFTSITESLDPEDVRNLQSRYFEVARSVIARYGGTLEKFIGDAVMAVWGAPTAHEDDSERAVRAALELVAAVGKLRGTTASLRLRARAAVATGEVAVTLGAEWQGMVAGDLVNTAARLQTVAPSGGVLVDDTTRLVVGDVVAFAPAVEKSLKGKSRPVGAWRAIGLAGRPQGRAAGHSGPFVGRGRELQELVELQRQTVLSRRSRLVSVVGIAGIGKSRLMLELERHLDPLPQPVALHVGRAPSYGDGITFAPLAEMVRRRARIEEGTDTELALRQLSATLVEFVPDELERRWIEPRLGTLLDPGSDVSYEREELFAAWRRFFERVADWAPVLLVFEDLQWADPALLDFIDHLASWSRDHAILIVALARPELLDRRPTWGAGQRSFTALHLEPLAPDAMTRLIQGLAPDLPADAVHRIVDHAGGVPLYGVEVVRTIIDRVLSAVDGPIVEGTGAPERFRIPPNLHSLISARIDALPPAERNVLLAASVLGRRFHPDALVAITRLDREDARARIATLVRRELLAFDDDLASPGRGQLTFVQDVVRDVASRTLARRERRTLHLAAADHLAAQGDDELIEAVAEQLLEAHRAAPDHPDSPAVAARAVAALRQAAGRALALRVPARALTHLLRALELADGDATLATIWPEAAVAARRSGHFDLAETFLRRLIQAEDADGRPADAARSRAQLASLLLAADRADAAVSDLEASLREIPDLTSDPGSVELAAQLARAHMLIGNRDQALAWADRTLVAAEQLDLPAVAIDALITRGTARVRLANDDAGLGDIGRAITDAAGRDLLGAELRARNNLAWLTSPDDPASSMETARVGLDLARQMGVGDMALQLTEVVCALALETGELSLAGSLLQEARERPQAAAHRLLLTAKEATVRAFRGEPGAAALLDDLGPPDPQLDAQVIADLDIARAWIAFVDGRLEDARRHAEAAAVRQLGSDQHLVLGLAARTSLWLRDADEAASVIQRLERLAVRGRAAAASELTLRAGVSALADDPGAGARYDEATTAWRSLGLPIRLALCLADRHRLLPEHDPSRGPAFAEAERILTGIGAAGLLHALRPVVSR